MRIKDFLLGNLPVKLLSLFFALVLWGVVIGEKKAQIQMNIPLELVNIPEKAVVVSDVPASISVTVNGPRTLLRGLPGRGIRKSIDLEGMDLGWTTIQILPDSISMPRGVEVVRVTPSTLSLRMEALKEVHLPVAPQLLGEAPKGYRIEKVSVDPPTVLLKGGEGELSDLREVRTHPLTLPKEAKDVEERTGLELDGLHLVDASPVSVWVRVKFTPILEQRILKGVRVRSVPPERAASIDPDRVEVLVKGPVEIIESLREADLNLVVDVNGLAPGVHQIAPKIQTPKGVIVLKVMPQVVKVALEEQTKGQDD